jgi:hypothetical protein
MWERSEQGAIRYGGKRRPFANNCDERKKFGKQRKTMAAREKTKKPFSAFYDMLGCQTQCN